MIPRWLIALFFSFCSYLTILFAIIVIDVFSNKDFNFSRISAVSMVYMAGLTIYFGFLVIFFKIKIT